jgi:hypothetical protein
MVASAVVLNELAKLTYSLFRVFRDVRHAGQYNIQ